MNKIVKLGFTKSKAYGLCGTILMAVLFSTAVVKADEVKSADSAPAIEAVAKSEHLVVPETTESAATAESAITAEPVATTESVVDHTTEDKIAKAEVARSKEDKDAREAASEEVVAAVTEPKTSTAVTKEGTEIKVENPDVHLEFPTGTDKYHGFKVEYRDVKIPDSIEINNGDSVKFTLPKEVSFQTNFDFDVTNKDNDVIGHAKTSIEDGTIKTVFNDYFKLHPMNKQISLTFDAKWTDAVQPGQKVSLDFDGSVQTVKIADRDVVPGDQLVAKWGSQSKSDPRTINWVVRLNYARSTLKDLTVKDTWSANQTFVEGSEKFYTVENMEAWTGVEDAKSYLESWNVRSGGFDAKFKTFNKLLYIEYSTKLKTDVKDSFNPTNKVELNGVESKQTSNSVVSLVGGKGNAQGENSEKQPEEPKKPAEPEKPTSEVPGDAPVLDKPEYNEPIGTVPGDAPVLDKPEWNGGTTPWDAPVLDKPEYNEPIGTTPWDAPVLEKPEYNEPIGVIPGDAPVLEKPELKVPNEEVPAPEVPATEIEKPAKLVAQKPQEKFAITELPNTGTESNSFVALGVAGLIASIALMKRRKED